MAQLDDRFSARNKLKFAGLLLLFSVIGVCLLFFGFRILDLLLAVSLYSSFFQAVRSTGAFPDAVSSAISVWLTTAAFLAIPVAITAFLKRRPRDVLAIALLLSSYLVILHLMASSNPGLYFNPFTGSPRFVYHKATDRKIELFPLGYTFHPRYGTKLHPVTANVILEYETQQSRLNTVSVDSDDQIDDEDTSDPPKTPDSIPIHARKAVDRYSGTVEVTSAYVNGEFRPEVLKVGEIFSEPALVEYDIGRKFRRFQTWVGVSDYADSDGPLSYVVLGDGRQLFRSRPLRVGSTPVRVDVDVRGVLRLRLVCEGAVSPLLGGEGSEAIWIDPILK